MKDTLKYTLYMTCLLAFLMYSFAVYRAPHEMTPGPTDALLAGKKIWQSKNCGACHQLYGQGGFLGPDITNVYSTKGPEYIKAFVKAGTPVMPSFKLSDAEIESLISFLQHTDASGVSDPRIFKYNWNGTIELK